MNYLIFQNPEEQPIPEKVLLPILDNIWFWIALVEFIFILILILIVWKRKRKNYMFTDVDKKKIKKEGNLDMANVMSSIHHARNLYKLLSKKCHPDRFVNDSRRPIAEEIFQEISKNRRDYKRLLELKERAKIELELNFDTNG